MSKAIAIFEMPSKCRDCNCFTDYETHYQQCNLLADVVYNKISKTTNNSTEIYKAIKEGSFIKDDGKRHPNCPLKPLPEKKHNNGGYRVIDGTEWFYDSEHDDGWNECIDEILGEEE